MKIASEIYHADMCGGVTCPPSLSNSLIKILIGKSPLHAFMAHPRLNPNYDRGDDESKFDVGTAAHALLLEGDDVMGVVQAEDWRTKAAKEDRDMHRSAGRIPVLPHQYVQIKAMRDAAIQAIAGCADLSGITLADGISEDTLLWREGSTHCRARLDWLSNDKTVIFDYKTTALTPDAWMRAIGSNGYDVQDAFYRRAVKSVHGIDAQMIFIVQETSAPYSVFFVSLAEAWQEIGNQKIEMALADWARCMKTGVWPGYDNRIRWAEAPAWAASDAEDRMASRDYDSKIKLFDKDAPGEKENFLFGKVES